MRGPWPLSWVSCQHITALAAYSISAWLYDTNTLYITGQLRQLPWWVVYHTEETEHQAGQLAGVAKELNAQEQVWMQAV